MSPDLNDKFFLDFKLTDIFESTSNFVLFINNSGKIVYANLAFCEKTGFTRQELTKYNFRDILSADFQIVYDNFIKKDLINGINWKGELEHLDKDNTPYWTSTSFTKLLANNNEHFGYFVIEDDITSIKELTNQLEYRANLLYEDKLKIEAILNNVPFSIFVLEFDGTILYENEIFKSSFKNEFKRELLINSNIYDYLPNLLIGKIKELITTKDKNEEIINLESNIHLQINVIPLNLNDQESIYIVVIRDITNFVEFELIQKQFVTTVSHELRTPIASVILSINNYIQYKEKLNNEQNENLLKIIQQNANVLKNIVEDLLIVSNIDNKKLQLRNWVKINVYNRINQVILQLKPLMETKNLQLDLECSSELYIFSDEERFNQIVRIPFENAIKYSEQGQKIIISVNNLYKGPYNPSNDDGILLQIQDFGFGIKLSEQKYLFKRFFRGSNVQNLQGTGIGLSILKELVNLVHGSIYIESEENIGTKVIIFLPLLMNYQ